MKDSGRGDYRGEDRYSHHRQSYYDDYPSLAPSRHLWVGNIDAPEAVVKEKFSKYGELESLFVYPHRQYAFINFRRLEDAENAKDALQNAQIGSSQVRIEFAKAAKPSRHLWVGGVSPNVGRDLLESEFQKYGHLEDFRVMRERGAAIVDYSRMEDAVTALNALNGKRFGDEELRIDYRANAQKRGPTSSNSGPRGRDDPHPPSEVLWIGLPPHAKPDEETIHRVFSPYGNIRVRMFSARGFCFVEYQSVREATNAKNALSGKPINGLRLNIEFSTREDGPTDVKRSRVSPLEERRTPPPSVPVPDNSWEWQGFIAKSGTAICQVRGFPATGKVDTIIPEIVNCTARTDLETLARHVYSLTEFTVVFFVPTRDVDVTPYQELLRYLLENQRAGVARLNDGSSLFLVPPSAFAEKILKISRNDCIFGVILNFRQPQQHIPVGINLPFQQQAPAGFQQEAVSVPPGFQQPPPGFQQEPVSAPPGFQQQAAAGPPGFQQQAPPGYQQGVPFSNLVPMNDQFQTQLPQQPQPPVQAQAQVPDQLAQLTALLQSQVPQAGAPGGLPQFSDPEQFQRTLALAAQLLQANKP